MAILDLMAEHSVELKRAKKKMGNLESELNKARLMLAKVDKLKADLVAVEQAQDSSYAATTKAQDKVAAALAQLKAMACDPVYERIFNRGSIV